MKHDTRNKKENIFYFDMKLIKSCIILLLKPDFSRSHFVFIV